ncbi:MAG TPA: glycoside hydrolase family 30 beta sandwich domain-containing protein [Solirubrobacteraceae bacterium]|nr:glycoside hydrolase family 30 beta sandwich domain-containing protein [Solirubrobacteraceae bacterium]
MGIPFRTSPPGGRRATALLALLCLLPGLAGCAARGTTAGTTAVAADPYRVQVIQTTTDLAQRLTRLPDLEFRSVPAGPAPVIGIDTRARYQRIRGFGAAMTDSSAWLIEHAMPGATRAALMTDLFGAGGAHLNVIKVPIGASDFTHDGRPYSYDTPPGGGADPRLTHFTVAHDRAYILPALRQARALDPAASVLATPWSPPGWMKANRSLGNAGNRGRLRSVDDGAWAAYFVRFIRAYARAGIPIDALTLQNEPGIATLYPGLNLPAGTAMHWLATSLAPALRRAGLHPRIYGGDLGWGPTTAYPQMSLDTPGARSLTGLAWHCYYGSPAVMSRFHRLDPRLEQIVDECAPGISPTPITEIVISSLRSWASTVMLWNLALDPTGGPAELPNHGCMGCRGMATIDPATGRFSLHLSYYELGQASAFVKPGARRIATPHFVRYVYPRSGVNVATPGLDDVALRNPDGSLVLIVYDNATRPIHFTVRWRGRAFGYRLTAGATATFVWNR